MKPGTFPPALVATFLALTALVSHPTPASAQSDSILYNFQGSSDGNAPFGGPVFDKAGDLYGTTTTGGVSFAGNVYQLTPPSEAGGTWTETSLYSFSGFAGDGNEPVGDLIIDSAGNLYGTTRGGGTTNSNCPSGCGTVFELSPPAQSGGAWTEAVLYSFQGGTDGLYPGGLFLYGGAIYGTTNQGGVFKSYGTVFTLRHSSGAWTEHVIYRFKGGSDGCSPYIQNMIADASGNLYGTTTGCGTTGWGTVFELSPPSGSATSWAESVLYTFKGVTDGELPHSGLAFDSKGNLYGTSYWGGPWQDGTVFELSNVAGVWSEQVIFTFGPQLNPTNGAWPLSSVLIDSAGNLFGSTTAGGAYDQGVVFKLSPTTAGAWNETVLHSFGNGTDGSEPSGDLVKRGSALYGVTDSGGDSWGTVFVVQ